MATEIKRNRDQEIDMLNGPLAGKILRFSLPLMLSGILQLVCKQRGDTIVLG